ncbi:MAG: hypothetical protein WD333_04850 [Dehalococcoidia bacterium]
MALIYRLVLIRMLPGCLLSLAGFVLLVSGVTVLIIGAMGDSGGRMATGALLGIAGAVVIFFVVRSLIRRIRMIRALLGQIQPRRF